MMRDFNIVKESKFVLYEGCVLRKVAFSPETFNGFMEATGGDRKTVEWTIHHIHVVDLFPEGCSAAEVVRLAWDLGDAGKQRLARQHPGIAMEVEVMDGSLTFRYRAFRARKLASWS